MNYFQASIWSIFFTLCLAVNQQDSRTFNKGKRGIADYSSAANLVPYHQQSAQRNSPYGASSEVLSQQPQPQYYQKPSEQPGKYYQVQQQQPVAPIPQKYIQASGYHGHHLTHNVGTPAAAGLSQKLQGPSYAKPPPFSLAGDVSSFSYSSPVTSYNSAGQSLFTSKFNQDRLPYTQQSGAEHQPLHLQYQRPEPAQQYQQSLKGLADSFQYQPSGRPMAESKIVYSPQEDLNSISQQYQAPSQQQYFIPTHQSQYSKTQQYGGNQIEQNPAETQQYIVVPSQQHSAAGDHQQLYLQHQNAGGQETVAIPQYYHPVNSAKYKENQYQ